MPAAAPYLAALELTLLHSLWQGAVIAFAVRGLSTRSRPQTRYVMAMAGLLIMPLAAVATFWLTLGALEAGTGQGAGTGPVSALAPWIDSAWFAGALGLLTRAALGFWGLSRLDAKAIQPPAWLDDLFKITAARMGVGGVRLKLLPQGTGPFTIGVLRAVVYMPVSAVCALTPDQIEAVLAHECEHIRRHDFAWNLVQVGIEAAFFYHPGAWWLSARMRDDRELCCDDAAVAVCRRAVTYASALLALEEDRRGGALAVALNGHGPSLLSRVRRVLAPEVSDQSRVSVVSRGLAMACVLVGTMAFLAGSPGPARLVASPVPGNRPAMTAMTANPPAAIKPIVHRRRSIASEYTPLAVEHVVSGQQQARDRQNARQNSLIVQHTVTPEQAAADAEAARREAARAQASA